MYGGTMRQPNHLADLYDQYDIFFCDIWGVLHNGISVYPSAISALEKARKAGKFVFLLTNSPQLREALLSQFRIVGLPPSCYDGIVTSGDITQTLIKKGARRIYHLGPKHDSAMYKNLDVQLVEEFKASIILCTGLCDDDKEQPDDYKDLLCRLRTRNLPFICANPDIFVHRGEKKIWCAGALARIYSDLGGNVLIPGKPHCLIYDSVVTMAEQLTEKPIDKSRVLAIGDSVLTDIKGAVSYGIDTLFIASGIHLYEYTIDGVIIRKKLNTFFERFRIQPAAFMMKLS
ncbi:MAG: subfamily IIA [Candidatus Tokpelaia sp. JSC161]|jgi:HAD superfamily hydrolase (TIGR01459 family)|nr:MAG: subfamily IIA [Candidatus Tokpelaia sp. JSC161]